MEINVEELVNFSKRRLDKIKGSRKFSNSNNNFKKLTRSQREELERLELETGERYYYIISGETVIREFIRYNNIEHKFLDFKDFKVCQKRNSTRLYINAREVILPPKRSILVKGESRLYVVRNTRTKSLMLFPKLEYPIAILPFFTWLRLNGKINFKTGEIFNQPHLETLDKIPLEDLKTTEQIARYKEYIKNELPTQYNSRLFRAREFMIKDLENMIAVNIDQSDIDKFIEEQKYRYKVIY